MKSSSVRPSVCLLRSEIPNAVELLLFLSNMHTFNRCVSGLTENDGHENDGPSKLQDMKLQDMKKTDQIAGHENAGHENDGPSSMA